MPEIVTEQQAPPKETVSVNWDAFEKDHTDAPLTQEKPVVEKPAEQAEEKPVIENIENKPVELTAEEKAKLETEILIKDRKELGLSETATKEEVETAKTAKLESEKPIVEFKADEILNTITPAAEGSWLRVAQDLKLEGVIEDTWEAVQKAVVAPYIKELEDLKTSQKVDYFSTFKPEVATNLMLLEMGIKEEDLFAPTRQIENYLALDDAAIVRENLVLLGWKDEAIDIEMEVLTGKNLVAHEATKLRMGLTAQKEHILNERIQLVQQFGQQKEQAALRQKEQEDNQFKTALNTVSKFLDVPVSPEIKQAILTKYSNGGYENDLKTANAKVEFILHKELGTQLIKSLKNTAFEKGRDEKTKKLLNVPPVTNSSAGQRVDTNNQLGSDNFSAFEKDFGNK